jgi:hypothetical protein
LLLRPFEKLNREEGEEGRSEEILRKKNSFL